MSIVGVHFFHLYILHLQNIGSLLLNIFNVCTRKCACYKYVCLVRRQLFKSKLSSIILSVKWTIKNVF